MTWKQALRHADEQIAQWKRDGIRPAEAVEALHRPASRNRRDGWWRVRQVLAAWAIQHRDRWED